MKRLALLSLVAVAAVGCQQGNPIVGNWSGSMNAMGMSVPMSMKFESNGKFTQNITQGPIVIEGRGDWKTEDKNLTMTPTDFSLTGVTGQMKTMIETQAKGQLNKPQTVEFKIEGDTLTWTPAGGGPITLNRSAAPAATEAKK